MRKQNGTTYYYVVARLGPPAPAVDGLVPDVDELSLEDNFSKALKRAQRPLGVRRTCLHFRHTFGTMLARNNVSLFKISKLLGNSPQICRKHYASLKAEDLTEEVKFPPAERGPERAAPAPGSGQDVSPSGAPPRSSLHDFMRRSLEGAELPPSPARQEEE